MNKILHINFSDKGGGAERIAVELAEATNSTLIVFKKKTELNFVVEFEKTFVDSLYLILNKAIYKLGIKKDFKRWFSIGEYLNLTYYKLQKNIHYQNCDIVHLHNIHGGYFDINALLKISLEKKIIWTLHDMWSITGGESHYFSNTKDLLTIKEYLGQYPLNNPLLDLRKINKKRKSKIYRKIKSMSIITPSKWLNNEVIKSKLIGRHSVDIIPNFHSENFASVIPKKDKEKLEVLLFNDIKNVYKGCNNIKSELNSIAEFTNLNIVGDSINVSSEYKKYDYFKSDLKLISLYQSIDILIFPSLAENLPLTILEALACGVCVISSNVGGIPELITNKESGFLFDPHNPIEILDIINLLDIDRKLLYRIKKNAIVSSKKFGRNRIVNEYLLLYDEILEK